MATRRTFLKDASLAGAATLALGSAVSARRLSPLDVPQTSATALAGDEVFWGRVAERYRVAPGLINLEAGYFGLMAQPVLEAFQRNTERVNSESSTLPGARTRRSIRTSARKSLRSSARR